ncbi:hypothetical protein COCMIDRAFT_28177 [Bipolaris oryzae ATCC 44560]|uniref:Uncharacterized protein n=1 Tax=Bipolaris oryzae ATCC 44560 TaxID=930090 RepID=W6Z709_COCMI|nr:uncharacterized protein COCMIDRAFT_28177 [Bipolaris oryzae ATCC 44560]EUC43339.1 hypothetical protein COCMIDRAFT_28177 [Bipolaris oryzae ATCC 44560]
MYLFNYTTGTFTRERVAQSVLTTFETLSKEKWRCQKPDAFHDNPKMDADDNSNGYAVWLMTKRDTYYSQVRDTLTFLRTSDSCLGLMQRAAIDESERRELPLTEVDMNMGQLTSNMLIIATAVRSNCCQQRPMCDNLSVSGAFIDGPLYTAIKTLGRGTSLAQLYSRTSIIQILFLDIRQR